MSNRDDDDSQFGGRRKDNIKNRRRPPRPKRANDQGEYRPLKKSKRKHGQRWRKGQLA